MDDNHPLILGLDDATVARAVDADTGAVWWKSLIEADARGRFFGASAVFTLYAAQTRLTDLGETTKTILTYPSERVQRAPRVNGEKHTTAAAHRRFQTGISRASFRSQSSELSP
ncbi:MAG: hypothetical protein WAM97_00100 [Acidimicrobiales bacterium]